MYTHIYLSRILQTLRDGRGEDKSIQMARNKEKYKPAVVVVFNRKKKRNEEKRI